MRFAASIAPIGFTRAHKRVHLVDEQYDFTRRIGDFVENSLEALLELTAILRTRNERAHIERQQAFVLEALGHVAVYDAQGHAFGNRRFTHARLTNHDGVVLGPARQHLHGAADFRRRDQ